jgi:FemAB-related protein (PEP-CTERM system-associated)
VDLITMPKTAPPLTEVALRIHVYHGQALRERLPDLDRYVFGKGQVALSRHPRWLCVLERGMRHTPYALEATVAGRTCGFLPLAYVSSLLFGRFLVSLPYLNSNGVLADDEATARQLVDEAVALADQLCVRHLELRHEKELSHPALQGKQNNKVHMRLPLPDFPGPLWEALPAKVRNQVRKGEKSGLCVVWGGLELLPEFYAVFSQNMRDLGTPVYSRRLFHSVLEQFPADAELCVVRADKQPVASALLLHGQGVTEVPSASSLRQFNHTCANMLMYWQLLERSIRRGQTWFDFGRATMDGNTYRFKKQWGATPHEATWQSYERTGRATDVRPDNPRFQRWIGLWQRLPVVLTRLLGPVIVRGIP